MRNYKIGLVLGGGGALGFSHVGVLQVIEENNIPIDIVCGTSMGAIVGGVYACGETDMQTITSTALKMKTIHLADVNFNLRGLFRGRKIIKNLSKLTKDKNIEDYKLPFCCVATDLITGKEVRLDKGNGVRAIRASMGVPGLFTPVEYDNMMLVDGGVTNNLPCNVARDMGADIIIAVSAYNKYVLHKKPNTSIDTLSNAFLLSIYELDRKQKRHYDLLIEPQLDEIDQFVFKKKKTAIAIQRGREAMEGALPKLKELIKEMETKKTSK